LYDSIIDINIKVSDHSVTVDEMERKLLDITKKRKKRKDTKVAE